MKQLKKLTGIMLTAIMLLSLAAAPSFALTWTDALRWFAESGKINDSFEADDVTAGNSAVAVDAALRDLTAEAAGGALAGLYSYSM